MDHYIASIYFRTTQSRIISVSLSRIKAFDLIIGSLFYTSDSDDQINRLYNNGDSMTIEERLQELEAKLAEHIHRQELIYTIHDVDSHHIGGIFRRSTAELEQWLTAVVNRPKWFTFVRRTK